MAIEKELGEPNLRPGPPLDPAIFIGVAALFAIVATLAALFPAHRATRVDPLVALRNEWRRLSAVPFSSWITGWISSNGS